MPNIVKNFKVYQPVYERFIQHAIRAMLSYAPIQEGPSTFGGKGDSISAHSIKKKN
jgi:hypothetical protein